MPQTTLKTQLLELFENLDGVKALSEAERDSLRERLLNLNEEQMSKMIDFLMQEKVKIEDLKKNLQASSENLATLLGEAKQASQHLQKIFLQVREKDSSQTEATEAEKMLKQLEEDENSIS